MCDDHHEGHEHEHHHHDALEQRAQPEEFRVVITGKGGVGKTSLTALLARLLAREAYRVLALDADPQMNLPYALGLPYDRARARSAQPESGLRRGENRQRARARAGGCFSGSIPTSMTWSSVSAS